MNKKIFRTIICISILMISAIPAMGIPLINNIKPELEKFTKRNDEQENYTDSNNFFMTMGPVSKKYSEVELINGSEKDINNIEKHLNRKLFQLSLIFRSFPVIVFNLTFSVQYKQNVSNTSRFRYDTTNGTVIWDEEGNFENLTNITSISCEPHIVLVENFSGVFIFFRARLFNWVAPLGKKFLEPARFLFVGFADKIIYS